MTEQGVTKQVIFDHCCWANTNFIFEGLRVKPAVNFRWSGGVYDFWEEDNNGGGSFWKEASEGSGRGEFLGGFRVFFGGEI